MSEHESFTDRVAAYFADRPNVWIDSAQLEKIGGRCAWRTRVSECRAERGMDIRNRQQRMTDAEGNTWTVSWYMFVPPDPAPASDLYDQNTWTLRWGRLGV